MRVTTDRARDLLGTNPPVLADARGRGRLVQARMSLVLVAGRVKVTMEQPERLSDAFRARRAAGARSPYTLPSSAVPLGAAAWPHDARPHTLR
ncbi:hypothetical protein AB0L59_22655 [Streptomyces sp. NPDC052109]|uniref:hypothetical protein n=1 Tax=Streptomyces sp. NPDC052109 TaxID=3155527 RepID=UPI003449ED4F